MGFQLRRVQQGLAPLDWKAMALEGAGVREIRIHTAVEHRVLYVASSRMSYTSCMRSRSEPEGRPGVTWSSLDNDIERWSVSDERAA